MISIPFSSVMRRSTMPGTLLAGCLLCLLCLPGFARSLERPFIWASEEERPAILGKIESEAWARSLYESLKERADRAVAAHQESRLDHLRELPLVWPEGEETHPRFPYIRNDRPGNPGHEHRLTLMTYIQDAVDCGVLYYLTEDTAYAQSAADFLSTAVLALEEMTPDDNRFNGGWIYPEDHLKESRIFAAQFPLIYDFIHPFLSEGGEVMNVVSGKETAFPMEQAQEVFRTYVNLAINRGIIDANWPVLESSSLVHNTLALEDPAERQTYLPYYLERNMPEQDSLRKVASSYAKPGDMWPESLGYSRHVTKFSIYLMTLLDRIYPDLKLGRQYPNIAYSLHGTHYLEFPNGDVASFGDGKRRSGPMYRAFEKALLLARLNDIPEMESYFASLLQTGLSEGDYDRGKLQPRYFRANPYFTPLSLLWQQKDIGGSIREYPRYRTETLPFAGIYIQRNQAGKDPVRDNLMAWVGGAHYVHGHASGMNIELYGKGEVLGHDAGRGRYRTDIHENYYRLFAAHNTVVSNGASAASGGWVELGINRIELESMEPMPRRPAVSENHSFSTTRFHDEHNLVAPARHERTLAVIRTSPTTGYYVDIFRAKSDAEAPFHDYIYRNLGESLRLYAEKGPLPLGEDDGRFAGSADLPWKQNNTFRHPGWHFFEDVKISEAYSEPVEATFFAEEAGTDGIGMHVFLNASKGRSYASVLSPPARNSSVDYYVDKPAPTLVVRKDGNAWEEPFAAVFEPFTGDGENRSIQSVKTLVRDGRFTGLVVRSVVDEQEITQVILVHEEDLMRTYPDWDLAFAGHFAVVSFGPDGKILDAYIGDGKRLTAGDHSIQLDEQTRSAHVRF
jgi:hypothetical protein